MNQTDIKAAKQIMHSNPLLFDLKVKDYSAPKWEYEEPTQQQLEKALKYVELFKGRQEAIRERSEISQGDWVRLKDGSMSRVTVNHHTGTIQIGGGQGSYHLFRNGYCSYSGGCGEQVKLSSLKDTGEYKPGGCWIFSNDWSGAGRGVHSELEFKVWQER